MRYFTIILIGIIFLSSSLAFGKPPTKEIRLKNGEIIEIEAYSKFYAGADDTWVLVLNYVTSSIDDKSLLKIRAEEIWKDFRLLVEKEGFNAAAITAKEYVKDNNNPLINTSESNNYTFVIIKGKDGNWKFLDNKD